MSRTDKDAPDWVRALHDPHPREHHSYLCETRPFGMARPHLARPCDLHETGNRRTNACYYYVIDRTRWYTTTGPNDTRRHLGYFGPERAAVRDTLRDGVRDYNAHGDTDVDPPTRQTRNSDWYGGYWD